MINIEVRSKNIILKITIIIRSSVTIADTLSFNISRNVRNVGNVFLYSRYWNAAVYLDASIHR